MYTTQYQTQAQAGMPAWVTVLYLIIFVVEIAATWKIFQKAGEPGWAAIVPIYNAYVLFKITWGSGWYFLLACIPCVNIVILILTDIKLAKAFNKSTGFLLGLIFLSPIFMCLLGFGDDEYCGVN